MNKGVIMSASSNSDGLYMTEAEYLEFEYNSEMRHEYINGQVIERSGKNPNHNRLTVRLSALLYGHLQETNCEGFGSQMRVNINASSAHVYPDLSVACFSKFTSDPIEALLNPILIIEVLSPSTEKFDRDEKFRLYRGLDSLREYVLVSQEFPAISSYYLNADNIWEFNDTVGLESSITLKSIDCTLSLADIYENVVFEDTN